MSSHNNQQRRVARRFKRTMQAQQRHQRGRIDGELALMIGLGSIVVICTLTCIASLCVALSHADDCTSRIDWENVPVYPPATFCDLRSGLKRTPACITRNQAVFKRLRASEYAALAFERAK